MLINTASKPQTPMAIATPTKRPRTSPTKPPTHPMLIAVANRTRRIARTALRKPSELERNPLI